MATVKKMKKAQDGKLMDAFKKASNSSAVKAKENANYTKNSFKTADSLRSAKIPFGKDILKKRDANRAKADSIESAVEKRIGVPRKLNMYDNKKNGGPVKAKSGGSFPDLNKDGKVTKADILKGRGVIAKKGAMIKKAGKAIVAKKMVKSIKKK
jgi:hypothetical protein